jgi:uncharacterized damage-inducible protein DinB
MDRAERPKVDDRQPADAIADTVEHVLDVAATWLSWDGTPIRWRDRMTTPHKALRRVADHMVDHLTQFEARLAGVESPPDGWLGSTVTTAADLAPFTALDLAEARSRLARLALLWRIALAKVPAERLDQPAGDEYTLREMAFCAAASTEYADNLGWMP